MKVDVVAFQSRVYSQVSFSNAITCQLMRYAINSGANSVFNSWSSRARKAVWSITHWDRLLSFVRGPFVNAKAEKAADHRHKTEVKTREREERRWQRAATYGAISLTSEPSLFNQFGLSLLRSPLSLYLAPFLSLGSPRLCRHSRSGRCRCPDVTSVTMSFNTRR